MNRDNKKQKRSTIIITDKYSYETKIINIKQKHIENFGLYKKILVGAVAFIVLLLGGLMSYIGYERYEAKKSSQELAALKNNLDDAITKEALNNSKVKQMWNNLNKADSSLQKIEKYLSNRNIKSFTVAPNGNTVNVGGEYYPTNEINSDLIQQRADELSNLLQTIQTVPIGLPHQGTFTSFFGERGNPFEGGGGEFHPGLDISGSEGEPIHATANGTVEFAGWRGGYGNCVMLRHGYGYETLYGHMSRILVHVGQQVQAGTVVGLLGSTGRSTGPHVHYEVIFNNEKQNPIKFLNIN
jgi:murein DD-endopeptidase MepM/ murein hydrolase activator NlpD